MQALQILYLKHYVYIHKLPQIRNLTKSTKIWSSRNVQLHCTVQTLTTHVKHKQTYNWLAFLDLVVKNGYIPLVSSPDPTCKGLVTRKRKVWKLYNTSSTKMCVYYKLHLLQTASFDKRWYLWLCFSFFALGHFLSYIQVKGAKSTASVLPNTL